MQEVFLTYWKVREANLFICQECNAREGYYGNMEVAMTQGFDHDLYMKMQTEQIVKRIEKFDNKLYLEFGGKLFDDYHAARVLPGFEMNAKIRILQELKAVSYTHLDVYKRQPVRYGQVFFRFMRRFLTADGGYNG